MFQQFREMQFADQFQTLQRCEDKKATECIPELITFLREPLGDEVMDSMVEETVKKLLSEDEDATVRGLRSDAQVLRKLCVQVAGDNSFTKALVVLKDLALACEEPFFEILTVCSHISISTEDSVDMKSVFRTHLGHVDPLIKALCIESLGEMKDHDSIPFLVSLIEDCSTAGATESSELLAAQGIQALNEIGSDECLKRMTVYIHHSHPTLRRLVHVGMIQGGEKSVPFLREQFLSGSYDDRIMVANIVGHIGSEIAGKTLLDCLKQFSEVHSYVRHAAYEAFGKCQFRDGVQFLLNGLEETDIPLLLGVIHSLDLQVNPGILMHIRKLLNTDLARYKILINGIVTARAMNLFKMLYKDRTLQPLLLDDLEQTGDAMVMTCFIEQVPSIPVERFQPYLDTKKERCFLVVDDSPSLQRYLRSILTNDKTEVVTAENGIEALHILERGKAVNLVVTDMNMPEMNGLELTLKIKKHMIFSGLPVIMVTTETEEEQKLFARRAGVDAFLTKPFKPEDLIEKVESFF